MWCVSLGHASHAGQQKFYRQRQSLRSEGLSDTPVCHLGRFQAYQEVYAGKIDVLITDPPYGAESLAVYDALGTLARAVLRPGGHLFILSGDEEELDARLSLRAAGLECIGVLSYVITTSTSLGRKHTSTGMRKWQRRHKPLLWLQQPGLPKHHRRFFPVGAIQTSSTWLPVKARPWKQDPTAFRDLITHFTFPSDVILDPMMGWGTTLAAVISLDRQHVIGIEVLPERYAYAIQRLGLARVHPPVADAAAD